ncbi:MAG: methyl-accepting chemotaxis protein [Rhodocyclales bacterium]|nr:methyl-accepting chemotaxis protein [Rhodocyclales bacterium]
MRFVDIKLQWKIILVAAVVFLPAMALGTLYFYQQVYELEARNGLGGLMNFVDAKQQGVIRFIGQNEKLASQLAGLAQETPPDVLRRHLRSIVETDVFDLKKHPFHEEIAAGKRRIATARTYHAIDLVRDGAIAVSSDPAREGRPWQKALDLKPGYSEVWTDGGTPVLSFGAPVKGGMLYVHADARMLTVIVNGEIGNMEGGMGAFYLAGVGKTFDYYIVNKDNLMITESRVRPDALLKARGSEFPWKVTQQDRSLNIACGKDGTYVTNAGCKTGCREAMGFYEGPDGKRMLGASMPFYDSGWTIVVEQEADELLGPLARLRDIMVGIGVLLGAVSFFLFVFVVRGFIVRPLAQLAVNIREMAASTGTFDLTRRYATDRGDEIGQISSVFDNLVAAFRGIVEEIRSESARLSTSMTELSSVQVQMAESSRQQMDSATAVSSSVEQLTVSVGRVVELAEGTRSLADQDLALSSEGAQVALRAAEEMRRVAQSVTESSLAVDRLSERSHQIGGIVKVIRDIADQTNMLALNAAIEAARAGEQGRGFAVVADEVRKLAERTSQSTAEIGELIEAVHQGVTEAAASMEQMRGQAESGVALVNTAQESLGRIADSARQTAAKVGEIAGATREQRVSGDAAATSVERIASEAQANHQAAQLSTETVQHLDKLARELEAAVAHFRT